MRSDTRYILSLDGGGFRGYAQSWFLKKFFQQAGITNFLDWNLISGTSIGGISAVAFALGKTPQDMIDIFKNHGADIFAKNTSFDAGYMARVVMGLAGYGSPPTQYSNLPLKEAINSVVDDNKTMSDIPVPVILTGWNATQMKPYNFSNILGQEPVLIGHNDNVVNAMLSTSAAPLFFPPQLVNADVIIDGGVMQNNPCVLAFSMIKKLNPTVNRFIILSVGTGYSYSKFIPPIPALNDLIPQNVNYVAWLLEKLLIDAPAVLNDKIMRTLATDVYDQIYYYRFGFDFKEGEDDSLDNASLEQQALLEEKVEEKYAMDSDLISNFIAHFKA